VEVPNQKIAFFFLQISHWFSHKTAAFYTEQCMTSPLFHTSQEENYDFVWDALFKFCMHAQKLISELVWPVLVLLKIHCANCLTSIS